MELAITVDVGDAFVKATYNLDGDVPLASSTYVHMFLFSTFATTVHYPNTADICTVPAGNQGLHQQLYGCPLLCAKSTYDYFWLRFYLNAFKGAQFYFYPARVCELNVPVLIVKVSKSSLFSPS